MLKEEHALTNPDLDVGFRVLKVDSSNMKDVYYSPDAVNQDDLFDQVSNIKEDRKPLDLLFQVLIDWGVDLSLPIEEETIEGKQVFFVDTDALAACFDSDIDEAFVKELASRAPRRAVFRDASYRSDSVKINVEQIFKLVSPKTALRCI
jgi:adenine-specific DNA-methyltransferase